MALTLIHEDPMAVADPESQWGYGSFCAASKERYGLVEKKAGEGDPWLFKGNGESRSNGNYRTLELREGDREAGGSERTELALNESRYGSAGGAGTFMLYPEGKTYQTWFSMWLPGNFQVATTNWQVVMQMKQTQPYTSSLPVSSPVIEMDVRNNKWKVYSAAPSLEQLLFEAPAVVERWTRFCFEVRYAKGSEAGWLIVKVDNRAAPSEGRFVAQYESEKIVHQTLATANGTQETGSPPVKYENEQAIPSHLRMGQYRNPVLALTTTTRVSNIQTYEVTETKLAERKNYVIKPNGLAASPGAETYNGTTVTFVSEHAKVAGKAAKVVCPGAASFEGVYVPPASFVPAGSLTGLGPTKFTVSFYIWLAEGDPAIGKVLSVNLTRQPSSVNDQFNSSALVAGFNRVSSTVSLLAETTGYALQVFFGSAQSKPASTFYFSNPLFEISESLGEYFDGSNATSGWEASWTGTTNESISKETEKVAGSSSHSFSLLGVGS